MSAEKAQALVLRARPFGETSAIITLLTREAGKVRGLAKGAWRPKSKFDAALDLLSICQVLVLHRSSGNLDLLTEAFLEHRFRIGRHEASFAAGLYIAELLDSVTVDADPQPKLFDLATKAIRLLSAPRPGQSSELGPAFDTRNISALIIHTELGILHQLGQLPSLYCCAECQEPLEGRRISFSMLGGEDSAHDADEEKDPLCQSQVTQLFLYESLPVPSTKVASWHSRNLHLEKFVPS